MRTKKSLLYKEQKTREIEKSISKFSQQFMSNSKWVRLVEAIVDNSQEFKKIQFKKIQSDRIGELYLNKDSIFEFDYWQTGFEGNNSFGEWLEYKEIELLIFPKTLHQNIFKIQEIIISIGEFYMEINKNELKLLCYKI